MKERQHLHLDLNSGGQGGTRSKNDTKGFWMTLKKYSGNRKETPPVDIDTFFEYFKNLNFCEEEYSDINIDEVCYDPMYNEMLNGIITEKVVLDAIKSLKNNKARVVTN